MSVLVDPSPNSQAELVMEPSGSLLEFVNVQSRSTQLPVNSPTGGTLAAGTVTDTVLLTGTLLLPWSSVAVKVVIRREPPFDGPIQVTPLLRASGIKAQPATIELANGETARLDYAQVVAVTPVTESEEIQTGI